MKSLLLICCIAIVAATSYSQELIRETAASGYSLFNNIAIYTDPKDEKLVQISAQLLQKDIELVTGTKPPLINHPDRKFNSVIIIGSIQNSSILKKLIAEKKINPSIKGKWEAYHIQTITANNNNLIVIAGSDRRGTAYGVFELSKVLGISPWYWWADVPVKKKPALYIRSNKIIVDSPRVKYRGIFINDEAPALSNWSKEKFGGFKHGFYEKVFELILRLKGNYLWPAMWGNAFYDDDQDNIHSANDYGIVIGTSHHEPLMRAHDEWRRYGKGKWNYDSNEVRLREFWRDGMRRATNEKIVSIGMRGDGDEPMTRETATALLEKIVKDQRTIIEEVTGKPASETPQLWALYKEVQDYYDKGMRVPDDVTLLLCDDNWGNIRRLPALNEKPRKGGYGIYYHFDYVGGPRNYKWLNTNPIPRVWEQMNLAWQYKARQIWIVNVGDIKPMEFPISFFLDYSWNPEKYNADNLQQYTEKWAADQFGNNWSQQIGDIITKYGKYAGRRKPELLDANTFSLDNYNEYNEVYKQLLDLLAAAEKVNNQLNMEQKDAYFQLVLHPVRALSNLYGLYINVARNKKAYKEKSIAANDFARSAQYHYKEDSLITLQYHQLGGGKWNHMMSQTHIGYTYWQQPPVQKMPELYYVSPDSAESEVPLQEMLAPLRAADTIKNYKTRNVFAQIDDNYVSIHADRYTTAVGNEKIIWKKLPGHGRTGSAITSFPVTAPKQILSGKSPHLEYEIYINAPGSCVVDAYFSPTLNFQNSSTGLQYAISIDDEQPQILSINKEDNNTRVWESWGANNIIIKSSTHRLATPGRHLIKYWLIDPGVVLQKIVLTVGDKLKTYLGPPESLVQ